MMPLEAPRPANQGEQRNDEEGLQPFFFTFELQFLLKCNDVLNKFSSSQGLDEAAENADQQRVPNGAQPFQLKKEKSTAILLAIIITFLACHLLRFIVQLYEVFSSPLHGAQKLFQV